MKMNLIFETWKLYRSNNDVLCLNDGIIDIVHSIIITLMEFVANYYM